VKIHEFIDVLRTMDPEGGIFVVLVNADGTSELFDVREIRDHQGQSASGHPLPQCGIKLTLSGGANTLPRIAFFPHG
jgi:hypothetical protein